ncbi:RDD family protein [Phaeocystidibacter marisrubri]|uniref:RDD family protein n=1 Tax=Phaeocystidibacter marisrubri TaxID=1577780 RepID=A0A6L3ZIF6_9FLAO|nr:RDD family protein [Phaeocystidibacter marisrubri]KAB2817661.1 RDD family protein [Phaeocystidibacter marisrubri]GGH74239.1 RDD family protein [Phaeocystidibacter marisrubri]
MKTVDIQTPQNVTLELQLASFGMRLAAFALDQTIFWLTIGLLSLLGMWFFPYASNTVEEIYIWLIVMPFYIFYSAIFELAWAGRTPGKRILGIRAIRLDGGRVKLDEVLSRWFMRIFDILLTSGALASVLILSGKYSQRLGDVLGGTIVVRDRMERNVTLKHILNLETTENYEPVFPNARLLSEEEALLIKQTVLRVERNPTSGHEQAVKELVAKLEEVLGITKGKEKSTDFLRKVLKDYIVMTR